MRPTVLLVCTANVCRSPYMEYLIEDYLRNQAGMDTVQVGSAGVRPERGGHICELVATRQPHGEYWDEFVARHTSVRATPSRIGQAKLILTASLSNRSALALFDPAARSRTFTVREAAWLGSDYVRDPSLEGAAAVTAFARYLNQQRGTKPPLPPVRTRWFSRPGNPLSIPDAHHLSRAQHLATLRQVEEMATVVARLMSAGVDAQLAGRT